MRRTPRFASLIMLVVLAMVVMPSAILADTSLPK